MREFEPGALSPVVRSANFIDVSTGTVWGPRVIGDCEVILVVSGSLLYEAEQGAFSIAQGQVLLIPPDVRHTLGESAEGARTVISCIHFEPVTGSPFASGDYKLVPAPRTVTDTQGSYMIRDLFLRCAGALQGYSHYRSDLASCIFHELWVRLAERWSGGGESALSPRLLKMMSFIKRNLGSDVGRVQLASEFGLTPQYVNALFKRELNLTPTEVIHRERVQRGYRLMMEEGLSVKETAARVGFNDQFYFSRIFKRVMKFPPSKSI